MKFGLWIIVFSAFCSFANADDTSVATKLWPESFFQATSARNDELQYRFTNALFENGEENGRLFSNDFNPNSSLPFQINRDIYNNYDLLNTYTVIDSVKFIYQMPLVGASVAFAQTDAVAYIPFPFANLSFGVKGSIAFRDIRQVGREDAMIPLTANANTSPEGDVRELNPYLLSSKLSLVNLAKVPFAIPLSRRNVQKMRNGELVSYTVSGQVGFGGSIGLKVLPTNVISVGVSAIAQTFLRGDFEVSVLKENERYAKVRIGRTRAHGARLQIQAGAQFKHFVNGFFIFKSGTIHDDLDGIGQSVLPFQFSVESEKDAELAVAYRYDLESAEGRDAFHHAVLGSFTQSEETALAEASSPAPSVTKLFNRSTLSRSFNKSVSFDLSYFFGRQHLQKNEKLSTEIIAPDGTSHLLRNTQENRKEARIITGNNEKSMRRMTVLIDRDKFAAHQENAIILSSENTFEDAKTTPEEFNQYTAQIETTLHEPNLFPVFPELNKTNYGKTAFYFGYSVKETGLNRFLHLDLQNRFKYPAVFLQARAAFDARNPENLAAALNQLFSDRKHLGEISELIFSNLDSSTRESFLVAQNVSFGSFENRGRKILPMEVQYKSSEPELSGKGITHASIENVAAEVMSDQKTKIHFTLSSDPEFIYFRLTPLMGKDQQDAGEFILYNRNHQFHAGHNEFILDPASPNTIMHKLSSKLRANESYAFTLGYRQKGSSWSPGATTHLIASDFYPKPYPKP